MACSADTGDAVIQFTGIVLAANLTCGNGTWSATSSFSDASLNQGDGVGLQIVSGTANRINVSIQYTGN